MKPGKNFKTDRFLLVLIIVVSLIFAGSIVSALDQPYGTLKANESPSGVTISGDNGKGYSYYPFVTPRVTYRPTIRPTYIRPTVIPTIPPTTTFSDDLSQWRSGWDSEYDGSDAKMFYSGGSLHVRDYNPPDLSVNHKLNKNFKDFILEVDVKTVDGTIDNWQGVNVRYQQGNYYGLSIAADGYYEIVKAENGIIKLLTGPTRSGYINQGIGATNHIRCEVKENSLSLSVNGHLLSTVTDTTFKNGAIGLKANSLPSNSFTEVAYNNLVITPINIQDPVQTGSIDVSSNLPEAAVYLDGTYKGTIPTTITGVTSGSHSVRCSKSGYTDQYQTVTVYAGQTASVSIYFPPDQTGSISVSSNLPGAAVYLDGTYKGTTPATITGVTSGSHSVRCSKSGYTDQYQTVTVYAGQTSSVTIYFPGQSGSISVNSNLPGAAVYLDGTNTNKVTPTTLTPVTAGSHTVRCTKNGYGEYSTSVNVVAGRTVSVYATLGAIPPTTGSISVSSSPSGAAVYLDGTYKGTTPTTITGVTSGSHSVRCSKSGYPDQLQTVTVYKGQTASVPFVFNPVIKFPPVASFGNSPNSGYAPLTVYFTDTSTGNPTSRDWDFGDGTLHSYSQNPTHTYTLAGSYTVTLKVSNNEGSSTGWSYSPITVSEFYQPDPIVGVWRNTNSYLSFDDRYHFYSDGTWKGSLFSTMGNYVMSGTWKTQGSNTYGITRTRSGTPQTGAQPVTPVYYTMIYDPYQNSIYDTRYDLIIYTPYQGDVMKGVALSVNNQTVNGLSNEEIGHIKLAINDKLNAIAGT